MPGTGFSGAARYKLPEKRHHRIKYGVLAFLLGSALLGVSWIFAASPLSLITRFYGLLIYPVLLLLGNITGPVWDFLGFSPGEVPRYATLFFVAAFFLALFAASKISRRFWCRYLCPSGAILALFSRKPLYRRKVSEACGDCGKCVSRCPMNAIPAKAPKQTFFEECILCRECEALCPKKAVSFGMGITPRPVAETSPARRQFLTAGLAGVGTAAVGLAGLHTGVSKSVGNPAAESLLRPPGALPEEDFLARCVRCGECMAACPTNALQPIWLEAGLTGIFSPVLMPRQGACSPTCNACGIVCPTHAVRPLPLPDKLWAKIGTAVILKEKCIAWEQQKKCVICDEVCPYNAIIFREEEGNSAVVPEVKEERCTGCGLCEHHCPVQNQAAIIVTPAGALRLAGGSFEVQGRAQGLNISTSHKDAPPASAGGLAPGFDPL